MIYTLQCDGGFAPDVDGQDAADKLWTYGNNIRLENGYLAPFDGHARLYDPPTVTPYGVFPLRTASADLWAYMSLTKAYAVNNSGTHFNITRTTGGDYTATADTKWTGGDFTGFLIFSNANDVPQSWNGDTGTAAANLANWTSTWRCKAIRPLRNYLVAVNITKTSTNYPRMVKWSHSADPGTLPDSWDEANATKDAGEQDIGDADGVLVDVVPLSDLGVIYSTNSYHAMQYIGGTFVWRFTKLSGQAGALSQNCVAQYPGGHVVLTAGDIVTHAGGAPTSIVDNRIRRNLFNAMDTNNYGRSFVVHNPLKSEVWVCIPEATQTICTRAYVWNYAMNTWTTRAMSGDTSGALCAANGPVVSAATDTWSDDTGTWEQNDSPWDASSIDASKRRLVIGGSGTRLFLADTGNSFDSLRPAVTAERVGLDLGNADAIKLVKSVRLRVDGTLGTQIPVYVGAAMFPDGPYTWQPSQTFEVGTSRQANFLASGRFIGIRLGGSVGDPWRLRSLDIEYEIAGRR